MIVVGGNEDKEISGPSDDGYRSIVGLLKDQTCVSVQVRRSESQHPVEDAEQATVYQDVVSPPVVGDPNGFGFRGCENLPLPFSERIVGEGAHAGFFFTCLLPHLHAIAQSYKSRPGYKRRFFALLL